MNNNTAGWIPRIGKTILISILTVILLFNIIGIVKRVFLKEQLPLVLGFGNAVVITGSMEPVISAGDMVIIHKQNSYKENDIITYKDSSAITHRIIEIKPDGYVTKGDANNVSDGLISPEQVIGRVICVIPRIGHVILFFQDPFGMLILILVLFAVIELPRLLSMRRENKGLKHVREVTE